MSQKKILCAKIRALYDIWCAARPAAGGLPPKSAIDIVDLGKAGVLPHAWLVEREPNGRFRYRVAGEEIDSIFRKSVTGKYIDDVFRDGTSEPITDLWNKMLTERLAFRSVGKIMGVGEVDFPGERMSFPLADDDQKPRYIIGVTAYDYQGTLIPRKEDGGPIDWVCKHLYPADDLVPGYI